MPVNKDPNMTFSTKPVAPVETDTSFPIVAIGASAGGLEACESFFKAMPGDTDMAFVVVVHLDPNHTSLMPELLQKHSAMPVCQITDGVKIEPNNVYVIPPNKSLKILDGILSLTPLERPRQSHLPIDAFLRSLAQDQGTKAIAIILSGTGTDGTLGLKAIKEGLGLVMVQSKDTAKYDGMPHNAIDTGLVDFVMPAHKMPEQLIKYSTSVLKAQSSQLSSKQPATLTALQKIFVILRTKTHQDFSLYKKNTICRRIERRMNIHQIEHIETYVAFLQSNENEVEVLYKELLIGVTNFFRDPEAFDLLKTKALPALLSSKPDGYVLRVWVAGCSSGEEAYSLAMLLQESMEEENRYFSVQIFATDLDEESIAVARAAIYPPTIKADVSAERLQRFFIKEDSGNYRVRKSIRENLVFAQQNIIQDPPFTKLDILSCRNLLIYLGSELQKKLLPLFYYSLKPDSLLFLGSSESLGHSAELFKPLVKKWKIFKRETLSRSQSMLDMPRSPLINDHFSEKDVAVSPVTEFHSEQLIEAILSESKVPPSVIIDEDNNIVFINGRTGRYLEPAEGKASANIFDMARAGLKSELTMAIRRVRNNKQAHTFKGLQVQTDDDAIQLDISVKPILNDHTVRGLLLIAFNEQADITIIDTPEEQQTESGIELQSSSRENELRQELLYIKESLQTTIEELETSNEELKSTNEELQSTNEELQSTNEEMETSKEELQSLNEESSTVNGELQSRIDELSAANDDMKNLLDSTDIATIFLDADLCVRRFTPRANSIIPLVAIDTGRPIKHFSSNLVELDINDCAQRVLDDLVIREQEVSSVNGTAYQMRVRPYRTVANVIDGVVITFEDITQLKKAQHALSESNGIFQTLAKIAPVGIFQTDTNGNYVFVNEQWCLLAGMTAEQACGKGYFKNIFPEDTERVKQAWDSADHNKTMFNEKYRIKVSGQVLDVHARAIEVYDGAGKTLGHVGTVDLSSKHCNEAK